MNAGRTSPDLLRREEIARARATPPEEKVRAGLELFDLVCRVMEDGIRSEHPEADDAAVRRMLRERLDAAKRRENAR